MSKNRRVINRREREEYDEEGFIAQNAFKQETRERKRFRNMDNALRSKNVSALLSYTDYDDEDEEENTESWQQYDWESEIYQENLRDEP